MLIKSPLKKEKVKENKRKRSAGKRRNGRSHHTINRNGHDYGKRVDEKDEKKERFSLLSLEPWKVILGAIVLGALGMLYLNHVFATQELLHEVNKMERQYNQAKRVHSDYKLTYDRMTGPTEIYQKAKKQGFINGGPAEKVIEVKK